MLNKIGGRTKGTPNRSTADAHSAITLIAERNVAALETWLSQIADGTPAKMKRPATVRDGKMITFS